MTVKIAFTTIVGLHGLIHLMGFFKAYGISEIKELTLPISKTAGALWAVAFLLYAIVVVLYLSKNSYWWLVAFIAVVLSQILIFYFWKDAGFGTTANVIILLASFVGFSEWNYERGFKKEAKENIDRTAAFPTAILTEEDLAHLPPPVQRYLNYVGVLGKPKIKNVKVTFEGQMRSKVQDWFVFTSVQYNCFDAPTRLFFMKANVKGLPSAGYHAYRNNNASMKIKLLSLIPVVDLSDKELFKTETVTFFNDLCLLAPAALINKNIQWKEIDSTSVKATFTNQGVSIDAMLYFNESGQLINFVCDDRKEINENKYLRFSTPISDYKNINGYHLCSYGEAVWHYPEGRFVYGKFEVKNIEYNVKQ